MGGHISGLGQRLPKTFNVTVSGGTGNQTTLLIAGTAIGYSIIAPSATAQYTIKFTDNDGYLLAEKFNIVGDCRVPDEFQFHYDHRTSTGPTLTITGTDGDYSVRVWFKL